MLKKFVCAAIALALCVGITLADEIRAVITKVDGDKVTFAESKGFKGEKGPEKTLPATGAKVVKAKVSKDGDKFKVEAGEPLEGGLKNAMFAKIGEKGVRATIITDKDDKKITEIRVFTGFGGKGKGGFDKKGKGKDK